MKTTNMPLKIFFTKVWDLIARKDQTYLQVPQHKLKHLSLVKLLLCLLWDIIVLQNISITFSLTKIFNKKSGCILNITDWDIEEYIFELPVQLQSGWILVAWSIKNNKNIYYWPPP